VAGKVRLSTRPAELNDIVQGAVDTIRPTAEAKGVTLKVELPASPVSLVCDPDRLQQVVLNLLVNAVKFTPAGGGVVTRIDGTTAKGPRVIVADTGRGISPTFLEHVFAPFRQGEGATTREHGGLGLGLAIVKQLVELHGGTVTAASDGIDRGATFIVNLPPPGVTAFTRSDESYLHLVDPSSSSTEKGLQGVRVLVVDDEVDTRELVTMFLREAGAETQEANSASSALAAIERSVPDVLVSDIGMPTEDGYDLLQRLRSRPPEAGGRLPALALTAFTRREDVDRSRNVGFAYHLSKPVDRTTLVAAVRQLGIRRSA
jgi:CheY-like chemotaxis protein